MPSSVLILLLVPKSLLHGIPITATGHDIHNAQYLQLHKIPHVPNNRPPPPNKIQHTTSYSYFGTTWQIGHEILHARTVGEC